MKLLVLNNVSAGVGDGAIYDFMRAASQPNDEMVLRNVDAESDFAAALADAGAFDAVVASGGDGTVASVCYQLRDTGVPILPFPAGTANLAAQNLALPLETHALAKMLKGGKTLDFDMGEMQIGEDRFGFLLMAGCGYDSKIMSDAKRERESGRRFSAASYFKAAFANPAPQKSRFSLDVDGAHHEIDGVGILFFNFSRIQFDINMAYGNSPRDGMMDFMVLATNTALELLLPFIGAAIDSSGKSLEQSNAVKYFRGRNIRVDATPALTTEFDGEPLPLTTPFAVRTLPASCRLFVSDEGLSLYS